MTIVSLLVVFFLAWGEWSDYRRVVIHPELVVDKGRGALVPSVQDSGYSMEAKTILQANEWRFTST